MDAIIGIMWNRNEADILRFTISKALEQVDYLLLADDGSTDDSFEIMKELGRNHSKIIHVQKYDKSVEKKEALLQVVRANFKPEDTLVQVIESDITILSTDIREAWKKYSSNDVSMSWYLINAAADQWSDETGCYPSWERPIDSVMSYGHWMEELSSYTFRPLPGIHFANNSKPWPRGFSAYCNGISKNEFTDDVPLLAHWGYRGPAHWLKKYNPLNDPNKLHSQKHKWPIGSIEQIKKEVPFFNGVWNEPNAMFPLNRKGWKNWLISPNRQF